MAAVRGDLLNVTTAADLSVEVRRVWLIFLTRLLLNLLLVRPDQQ